MILVVVGKMEMDDMKEFVKDSLKLKIKVVKIIIQYGINVIIEGLEIKCWFVVYWLMFFGRRFNFYEIFEKGDCLVLCEWISDQFRVKEVDVFLVYVRDL